MFLLQLESDISMGKLYLLHGYILSARTQQLRKTELEKIHFFLSQHEQPDFYADVID